MARRCSPGLTIALIKKPEGIWRASHYVYYLGVSLNACLHLVADVFLIQQVGLLSLKV